LRSCDPPFAFFPVFYFPSSRFNISNVAIAELELIVSVRRLDTAKPASIRIPSFALGRLILF
jgi:hypothetical protein